MYVLCIEDIYLTYIIILIISPTDIGVKNPNPKCLMDGLNYME